MRRFTALCIFCLTALGTLAHASVEHRFQALRSQPKALYQFLKAMPKGGELHYHFDGAVYAETMLTLASQENVCFDAATMSSQPCKPKSNPLTITTVLHRPELIMKTVHAWSMQDFTPKLESAYEHFHAVFPKLFTLQTSIKAPLLAEILKKAGSQNEQYLEIIAFGFPDDAPFAALIHEAPSLTQKRDILLKNKHFQQHIQAIVTESQTLLPQARAILNCATNPSQPACKVHVQFQCYVRRVKPIDEIFVQALAEFIAADRSDTIVGVNLVDIEDGTTGQQDYAAQMRIFEYLHNMYPNVSIALHAGELFPKTVAPHFVKAPIRDAIDIGHAKRIGHGLDILEEPNPSDLAKEMVKQSVAVEINLTSNRLIFGVEGKQHPLQYYLKHDVPVVLSTDDEGILRTELTQEYVEAVTHHHLDYATLKQINRNALTYGFIRGRSLWQDPHHATPVRECQIMTSKACKRYIHDNLKAKLQWNLEQALATFERRF